MLHKATKIAISLPYEAFKAVEARRRELGLGRSAAILHALRFWLQQKEQQTLDENYARGYKQKPENPAELDPLFRAGLASFPQEDW